MALIPKLISLIFMAFGFYLIGFSSIQNVTMGLIILVVGAGLLMITR